jgi:hypothetical protein
MTVRIFRDVEEALSREVRRITFHDDRTVDHVVLRDTFDPFTGEVVALPIEPDFYDSSADTKNIQYPHFFLKLLKSKEDRTTGRVIPQYGKTQVSPITTSSQAFEIVIFSSDGVIAAPGNTLTTGIFQIKKIQVGHILRIRNGNNIGSYKVATVVPSAMGNHTVTVSADLVEDLPELTFNVADRIITFLGSGDLNTVKVGDNFIDDALASWPITAVDPIARTLTIGGVGSPNTDEGGKVTRPGNVFQMADGGLVSFTVMDPTKPVLGQGVGLGSDCEIFESMALTDPQVPLDLYYLVRIDSKERDTHIDVANRMWEEFNPPRTALATIVRSKLSAEQLLTVDVVSGGSNTIQVADNTNYNINDKVFVFDDFVPTKAVDGKGFQQVFESTVVSKIGTTQLVLSDIVPDSFIVENHTKVVSNASYRTFMFHFVDHVTKDVEGAQYWSHEFTFWIQVWVDRQGEPSQYDGTVQDIGIIGVNTDDPEILD